VTSAGSVRLCRQSFRCSGCGDPAYPLDGRLGLEGFLSFRAMRLACLAAASWSFDVAADRLAELAGVTMDGDTLRRYAERAARGPQRRHQTAEPAAAVRRGGWRRRVPQRRRIRAHAHGPA
jgi:hypothetical protein